MVPNGWQKTDLQNFINIKHGFAFKSEFFRARGEHVLLTPGSFYESGGFRDQGRKTKFFVGEIPSGYLLSRNDLLLAMTKQAAGLLGSPLFVPEDNRYLHNQRLGLIQIKSTNDVCLEFLYSIYNSPYVRKQIAEQSTGTKVKHTSPDKLKSVVCLLPPLREQHKIALILSTWDKAIATTEKLIESSTQQKKALMQQLLTGTKRLINPDTGMSFKGDWKRHSLSDLAFVDKESLNKKTPDDFSFEYISLSDVAVGIINKSLETHRFATSLSRARRIVKVGDVLLSTVRPNLKGFAKVSKEYSNCIASTGFAVLTPKESVSGGYIYQYIFSAHITGQIGSLVVGSNYPAINSSDVAGLKIYCPSYEEQQKIASVLTAADKEIEVLEAKLSHLRQEKKALMQQLLTGKRRVKLDGSLLMGATC